MASKTFGRNFFIGSRLFTAFVAAFATAFFAMMVIGYCFGHWTVLFLAFGYAMDNVLRRISSARSFYRSYIRRTAFLEKAKN